MIGAPATINDMVRVALSCYPLRRWATCPQCSGTGRAYGNHDWMCPRCQGRGVRPQPLYLIEGPKP